MKKICLLLLLNFIYFVSFSQEKKSLLDIIDTVYPAVGKINFDFNSDNNFSEIEKRKDSFFEYLSFVKQIEKKKKLNGSISFGFIGNEVENSDLFIISTGMEANYGVYPLEIEAKTNIQTQVNNGKFEENLSSLEISLDYHPFDDLTSEAYAFIIRTKNTFLGINQRYEIGGGYIVNLYSAKPENRGVLTKGQKLLTKLKKWRKLYPNEKLDDLKVLKCIETYCTEKNLLTPEEVKEIFRAMDSQDKTIKKLYSKHRIAFLFGLNYEIERTENDLSLFDNNNNLIGANTFEATNLFRLVLAPKYELRGERFKWKNTFYFKTAIIRSVDDIYTNEAQLTNPTDNMILRDKRLDYWLDLKTSFEFEITNTLSFISTLNYIYDNAPKRQYFLDSNSIFQVARAEHKFTGINFKLKYTL